MPAPKVDDIRQRAIDLGRTMGVRAVAEQLSREGLRVGKSAVAEWLRATRSKQAVAQAAQALAATALAARPPVLKAKGGVTRMLGIVDAAGRPTGRFATHGQVLQGAARKTELALVAQDGVRPTCIVCVDCPASSPTRIVDVAPAGPIPLRCKACSDRRGRRLQRQKHPEKFRAKVRRRAKLHPERERERKKRWRSENRAHEAQRKRRSRERRRGGGVPPPNEGT